MNRDEIVKIIAPLLVLPNSVIFEELESFYIELANDLTTDELRSVVKDIIVNEDYFPLPKRFNYYIQKVLAKRKKEYILMVCDNEECTKVYVFENLSNIKKGLLCPNCKKGKLKLVKS